MKTHITSLALFFYFVLFTGTLHGQGVSINADGSAADPSAILDVNSDARGLLLPRLTASQVDAIESPAAGLVVYNTTLQIPVYFDGTSWCI